VVHATRSNPAINDVLPGDAHAVDRVEGWFRQYAATRDPGIRERIIVSYLGLADRLAERYRSSRGATPEDLRQTARVGLVAAVDRYDPDYGNPFVPYAVACVVGEIKRYLRDSSWRLHVPRPLKERALRLARAADELHQRLGRSPTTLPEPEREIVVLRFFHDLDQYDIAARVGCSQMHVSRLLRRALGRMRNQLLVS
jgi:RNA polymerase sigma factor (sigma-70 family)